MTPGPGHNQGGVDQRLTSLVSRIERLNGEKADLQTDIKEVYTELKSAGYDAKVVRTLIAKRKRDAAELAAWANVASVIFNLDEAVTRG